MVRRRKMRLALWLCVSAIAISVAARAEQPLSLNSRVTTVLARMASRNMATRNAALDDLIEVISEGQKLGFDPEYPDVLAAFLARHPNLADRVKLGLINLLKADDDAHMDRKTAPGTYTENDSEHWAAAIELVASLNDERAIPALVGALGTGGLATGGVVKYGQNALGPVLREFRNPNPLVHSAAVGTAITILRMKNDAAAHAQILEIIRTAITDPEFMVRSAALYKVEDLTDREQFLPALREMAQHDPFTIPVETPGETSYPLRIRAKKLLEKIANH
jgi:hypothetical protein